MESNHKKKILRKLPPSTMQFNYKMIYELQFNYYDRIHTPLLELNTYSQVSQKKKNQKNLYKWEVLIKSIVSSPFI